MPKYHQSLTVPFMLLAMVLFWFSAHDWYVTRINLQQQQLIHELKQGGHDLTWKLQDLHDLVAGFGSGWILQPNGLQIDPKKAEISLAFNDRFIVPDLYQRLRFDWTENPAAPESTHLQLEFSQVDLGVYYYSPTINVKKGVNQINLSELSWNARKGQKNEITSWYQLPTLNTLVWRFSQQKKQTNSAFLSDIKIPQSKPWQTINQSPPLTAKLSNQLREQWQSQRLKQGLILKSPPVMQAYVSLPPWLMFVLGVLSLLAAVKIYQPSIQSPQAAVNKNGALIVIALVAVVAAMMQTRLLFAVLEQHVWIATVVFMMPVLLLVKRWLRPKNHAAVIWIITLLTVGLMFLLSHSTWAFVGDLPLYLLWALAQQVILGPLVSDYLRHKAGFSVLFVALICGVLFALLHMPNQMLMLATFFAGMLWSYAWLRYQNIYANAVSHALLALLFYQSMPAHLLGTARVGLWF
ncbi:MAG: CPBP family intramembrane metalloprotease [Proteobacteria bacterium]|nr:MAG: CPBP family intramembrane metalloprotease [Pseudomonadota bacterium]